MNVLNAIASFLNAMHKRLSQLLLYGGVLLMATMTLAVLVQIVMRYLLARPIAWVGEYCVYAMFVMTFMGAPYLFLKRLNICMTLFYDKIHDPRKKLVIDCILNLAIIVSTVMLFPDLMENVIRSYTVTTAQLPLSRGQILSITPLAFALIITITVGNIVKDITDYLKSSLWKEGFSEKQNEIFRKKQ